MAYHPETIPADKGLNCFMDQARFCNASCMAFMTTVPAGPDYKGQQWAHCRLLTDMHKGAKHLTIIAQGVGELAKVTPPIPVPRGVK